MIQQALARHSARPVPPSIADLLQRWANKRERITVYASAVLVEFPTAADLDAAVSRGIVSVKLTDRMGLTADGKEPPLGQLCDQPRLRGRYPGRSIAVLPLRRHGLPLRG